MDLCSNENTLPIPANVPDHRGREDDVATGENVVAASGASDGSPIQARR